MKKIYRYLLSFTAAMLISTGLSHAQQRVLEEGFENTQAGELPDGWTQTVENGVKKWVVETANFTHPANTAEGKGRIKLVETGNHFGEKKTMLVTPAVSIEDLAQPIVVFDYAAVEHSTGKADTLRVYYRLRKTGNWILAKTYGAADEWTRDTIDITSFVPDFQVAFEASDAGALGIAIDNVCITSRAQASPVSNVQAYNLIHNEGKLRWTGESQDEHWVKIATAPLADPDAATAADCILVEKVANNTSLLHITGLTSNTTYYYYIQSDRGHGDVSPWVSGSFTTACDPVQNFSTPFDTKEDEACWLMIGEGYNGWIATKPSVTNDSIYAGLSTSGDQMWWFNPSTSGNGTPTPIVPHTGASALQFAGYGLDKGDGYSRLYAVSPRLADNVDLRNMQLRFWVRTNTKQLHLRVMVSEWPDDFSQAENAGEVRIKSTDLYEQIVLTFETLKTNGKYIAFMIDESEEHIDIQFPKLTIDDVALEDREECNPASKVVMFSDPIVIGDQATLAWNRSGSSKWEIKVSNAPFNPLNGKGTILEDTIEGEPQAVVTGLISATRYFYYVRPICQDGVAGAWSNEQFFDSDCVPEGVAIPFSENFDKYSKGQLPPCWASYIPSSSEQRVYITSLNTYAHSLYNYIYCHPAGASYLITPKINANLSDCQVRLAYSIGEQQAVLEVGVLTDPTDMSTFTLVETLGQTKPAANYGDFSHTWQETIVKLDQYAGQGQYVAFKMNGTEVAYRIDDVVVEELSGCLDPDEFHTVSIGNDNIALAWTPVSGETQWEIAYGVENCILGQQTRTETVKDNPEHTLQGLQENTAYDIYLRSICPDGNGRWIGPLTVKTQKPVAIPPTYECDFEDNLVAGGWTLENGPQTNQWVIGDAVADDELDGVKRGKALYISDDYGLSNHFYKEDTWVYAYQTMELVEGMYDFEFDWRLNGGWTGYPLNNNGSLIPFLIPAEIQPEAGNYYDDLYQISHCGVATYGAEKAKAYKVQVPDGWLALSDSVLSAKSDDWQRYKKTYQLKEAGRYHFVLVYITRGCGNTDHKPAAVDNVKISLNTTSCLAIEEVRTFDITQSEAKISFMNYNADAWKVVLTDSIYELGLAETLAMGMEHVLYADVQHTNPVKLTGMQPETEYYAYIRPECGTDWVMVTFSTICNAMDVPLAYNFDDMELKGYMDCWRRYPQTTNGYANVEVTEFRTYQSEQFASNSTHMLGFTSAYGSNQDAGLVYTAHAASPEMFRPLKDLQVRFRLYSDYDYAVRPQVMEVGVMSDPLDTATFELVEKIIPVYGGLWKTYTVYFDAYEGSGKHVALRMPANDGFIGTLWIDDLEIDTISGCTPPRNLTVENITYNSAELHWKVIGDAMGRYHVKVSTKELTRWEDKADVYDNDNITNNTVKIEGLASAKFYYVYIRTMCAEGGYSDGQAETTFRTECGGIQPLPYYEDFESYEANEVPACWIVVQKPTGTSIRTQTLDFTSRDKVVKSKGKLSLVMSSDKHYPALLALPAMECEHLSELALNFEAMQPSSGDVFVVGVMEDLNDLETFVPVDTVDVPVFNEWTNTTVDFSGYTGPGKHIAFFLGSSYFGSSFYLENVMVRQSKMLCSDGTTPQAIKITATEATIQWADNTAVDHFQLKVADHEINPEVEQGNILDTENQSGLSKRLTGLTPGTEYYVYLRNACDGQSKEIGYWSKPVTFKTGCADPETMPYDENFTGYGSIADMGFFPDCWRKRVVTYGSILPVNQPDPYIASGTNNSLFMKAAYDAKDNSYAVVDAVTPELAFEEGTDISHYMLSFRMRSTVKEGAVYVGTMSDPSDATTFAAYDTLKIDGSLSNGISDWETKSVNFMYVTRPTDKYVAFRINSLDPQESYQVNITDLHMERMPDCMPPYKIVADKRHLRAFISWLPGDHTNHEWAWYCSDRRMDLPFTDEDWENLNSEEKRSGTTTGTKILINGTGEYGSNYFYIKTLGCDTFATEIVLPERLGSWTGVDPEKDGQLLPIYEPFSNQGFGYQAGEARYSAFPDYWMRQSKYNLEERNVFADPITVYQADSVAYPYITADSALYFKAVEDTLNAAYLFMQMSHERMQNVVQTTQLRFMAKGLGESDTLFVSMNAYEQKQTRVPDFPKTVEEFTFLPIVTDTIVLTGEYKEYVVKFEEYDFVPEGNEFGRMRISMKTGHNSEFKVKELHYEFIPYCYTPELKLDEKSESGFTVSWGKLDDQNEWQVAYGLAGFDPETANHIPCVDTLYRVVNLLPGKPYEVYVRSLCGNGMKSEWARLALTTDQTAAGFPYSSLTFDDATVVTADTVHFAFRLIDMPAGPHNMEFEWQLPDGGWLRAFLVPGDTQFATGNDFGVSLNTQPADWSALGTYTGQAAWTDATAGLYVSHETKGASIIAFAWTGNDADVAAIVRNIDITGSNECTVPEMLAATQITSNSALLGWVSHNADKWHIQWGKTGENPRIIWDVQPSKYLLEGLEADTEYFFEVSSACREGDWSERYTFRTACVPVSELDETFDAGIGSCWTIHRGLLDAVLADPAALLTVTDGWGISEKELLEGNGTPGAMITVTGNDCAEWLISPAVKLDVQSGLSFDLALTGYGAQSGIADPNGQADDRFIVLVSPDEGRTWDVAAATEWNNRKQEGKKVFNLIGNTPERIQVDLSAYTGKTVRIAFYAESTVAAESNDLHIDNVRIDCRFKKELTAEYCQGYSYQNGLFDLSKEEMGVPGKFDFTALSPSTTDGCDTTVILHMTIKPQNRYEYSIITCSNEPYSDEFGHFTNLTETGDYESEVLAGSNGCDSIVILHLTVNPAYEYDREITIQADMLPWEYACRTFEVGTKSSTYVINCPTEHGCDSIVNLKLTVLGGDGLDEAYGSTQFVLSPNPVERGKVVTVQREFSPAELQGMTVELINNLGMRCSVMRPAIAPVALQVPDVPGIYMVRIVTGTKETLTGRFIVR